jgi:hypothetical protein
VDTIKPAKPVLVSPLSGSVQSNSQPAFEPTQENTAP